MATKKKTKNKQRTEKKTVVKKRRSVGKNVRKTVAKKKAARRSRSKAETSPKKAAARPKVLGVEAAGAKSARVRKKPTPRRGQSWDAEVSARQSPRSRSVGQSGDLQGLSNVEAADSESVEELLEEGNAFEADVVAGVESAGDAGEKEIRTHEVPEDDVPGEYLDTE
jgi:hypothetical protein